MKKSFGNNEGYILIFSLIIIIFLTGMGGMIFLKSVNEKIFAQKFLDYIKAGYAAEQGINSAMYEITSHTSWKTHNATANVAVFDLVSRYPDHIAPVTAGLGEIDTSGDPATNETYGCYVRKNADGTTFFAVKVYGDPISGTGDSSETATEKVILARGYSNGVSRLLVTKFSARSLYDFFIFVGPQEDYYIGWKNYDASGGAIHSNGNFVLREQATIKNFSELSTPLAIKYMVNSFVPPDNCISSGENQNANNCRGFSSGTPWEEVFYEWRTPKTLPNNGPLNDYWGTNLYLNKSDGHLYGDSYGILMMDPANTGQTKIWDGLNQDEALLPNENPELYFTDDYPVIFANDKDDDGIENFSIPIPNRLSGGTYPWNIYEDAINRYGYTNETTHPVNYTNSEMLPVGWQSFIDSSNTPLGDLIKEKHTDGKSISPLLINSETYESEALSNGMVITRGPLEECLEEEENSPYAAIINGVTYCANSQGRIVQEGAEEFPIMERKTFWNASTAHQDTVISVNVSWLYSDESSPNELSPNNGIIYSNQNILLHDPWQTTTLRQDGITILSTDNLYLKGNFNYVPGCQPDWVWCQQRPAAAIAAGDIYLLSKEFEFPPELPATIHNPNFPDVHDVPLPGEPGYGEPGYPYTPPDTPSDHVLPNKATSTTYNVSLIGYRGHYPRVLERWVWDGGAASINVKGSFVQLPPENFTGDFVPGDNVINKVRCYLPGTTNCPYACAYEPCCRDCDAPPNGYNEYFPSEGMTTRAPGDNFVLRYEESYLDPSNPRPPGDLHGFSQKAQLEIDNTEYNFTHHYMAIF